MKKRSDTYEETRILARKIRNDIDGLEQIHHKMEEQIRAVLNSVAELIQMNRESTSPYVTERATRLKDLLIEFQEDRGYKSSSYSPLFRQVDRILDSSLSEYMSESLNKKLSQIVDRKETPTYVTGLNRYIYYRLGDMTFRIYGRLLERITHTSGKIAERLHQNFSGMRNINFFPYQGTDFYEPGHIEHWKDLLIVEVPSSNDIFALWCDEVIRMDEKIDTRERKSAMKSSHRLIEGKAMIKGTAVYLLNPSNIRQQP